MDADTTLVATVVVRPASGERLPADAIVTTDTLDRYRPTADAVDHVTRAFADAGFEVGPFVGIAMSIAGPASRFERVFRTRIGPADEGGVVAGLETSEPGRQLPLRGLPDDLSALLEAVTFEPPAELHDDTVGDW